jgi:hypothetical protein
MDDNDWFSIAGIICLGVSRTALGINREIGLDANREKRAHLLQYR